ncbi:hypothetical protein [Ekhidna sp.]|uniref:hypothetical protein n=1 Tax=Ekhidna sp. TaxID=2608089 RepID=UPI003BAD303F
MTYCIKLRRYLPLLPFIIPLLCIFVVNSSLFEDDPVSLSAAITFDLLISTPVLYFLTIRKSTIPKSTVVPVFILGIIIAFIILPSEHQYYLTLVKTWFLPILEISIITYVIISIRKAFKQAKSDNSVDFFTLAKEASAKLFPKKLAILFATELSVFYYGLMSWRHSVLKPNEYTYHKTTSTRMTLGVFIGLIIIEAVAVHLLLQSWSSIAAWILTGISIYGCLQILGILKSLSRRPIAINKEAVTVRYGIMNEAAIAFENIKHITPFTQSVEKTDGYVHLSPFKDMEGHNVLVELHEEMDLSGFYGIKKTFKKLLIYVDNPDQLIQNLNDNMAS